MTAGRMLSAAASLLLAAALAAAVPFLAFGKDGENAENTDPSELLSEPEMEEFGLEEIEEYLG